METEDNLSPNPNDGDTEIQTSTLWKHTLERIVHCIVVLKTTHTRAFDTEVAGSSYATGFVVDKSLGIILTNRHVVTTGVVVAEAVFQNREELRVVPLYVDPVHDFAFVKFDPKALQFMEVGEIPLAPEAAAVGLDVRVVGNDSGEKISILSGTLARLDRDAPRYGHHSYNDFNTFYLQAASGTKGGSSGSPVIDVYGRAVALNAGGKNKAASAYYLPLHRIVRALHYLKNSIQPDGSWTAPCIPRGDLQATFLFKGFDELKRLGLRQETEASVRGVPLKNKHDIDVTMMNGGDAMIHGDGDGVVEGTRQSTGMLVLDSVVPGGPLDGIFQAGDILVRVNNSIVIDHLTMETILDDHSPTNNNNNTTNTTTTTTTVTIEMERGGTPIIHTVPVQDLHSVIPTTFLEFGAGIVHSLSYHQARNNHTKVGSVYVAESGYMLGRSGVPRYAIITSLHGHVTPTLTSFIEVLTSLKHGSRVPLEYFTFDARNTRKKVILHVNWSWYGMPLLWEREERQRLWVSRRLNVVENDGGGDGQQQRQENNALLLDADEGIDTNTITNHDDNGDDDDVIIPTTLTTDNPTTTTATTTNNNSNWRKDLETQLRAALVIVDVEIPLCALADGIHSSSFCGCGFIAHLSDDICYVVIDRNTVSIAPGDIVISFGAFPAEITGKVCFLHPLHNFAIISFDPRQLSEQVRQQIRVVQMLPDPPLQRGDDVELVCLSNKGMRILHRTSMVTNPAVPALINSADVPRYRAVNEEVVKLDHSFGVQLTGVVADKQGRVRALWCSYSEQVNKKDDREWTGGLPVNVIVPWLKKVINMMGSSNGIGGVHGDTANTITTTTTTNMNTANTITTSNNIFMPPTVLTLDAELEPVLLSKAAHFGLPADWIQKLMHKDPERRQVLRVKSTVAQSEAKKVLCDGDMLLMMDGEVVVSFGDVEKILLRHNNSNSNGGNGIDDGGDGYQKKRRSINSSINNSKDGDIDSMPMKKQKKESKSSTITTTTNNINIINNINNESNTIIYLTLCRNGQLLDVSYSLGIEDGIGTRRLVHFAGAQIQAPHRAVRELGYMPEEYDDAAEGVYISRWYHGSPAHRYSLYALHWILEVNGKKTPNLDSFLDAVKSIEDGAAVRIKMKHIETMRAKVLTLKTDLRYWPTWELVLNEKGEWMRREFL